MNVDWWHPECTATCFCQRCWDSQVDSLCLCLNKQLFSKILDQTTFKKSLGLYWKCWKYYINESQGCYNQQCTSNSEIWLLTSGVLSVVSHVLPGELISLWRFCCVCVRGLHLLIYNMIISQMFLCFRFQWSGWWSCVHQFWWKCSSVL